MIYGSACPQHALRLDSTLYCGVILCIEKNRMSTATESRASNAMHCILRRETADWGSSGREDVAAPACDLACRSSQVQQLHSIAVSSRSHQQSSMRVCGTSKAEVTEMGLKDLKPAPCSLAPAQKEHGVPLRRQRWSYRIESASNFVKRDLVAHAGLELTTLAPVP